MESEAHPEFSATAAWEHVRDLLNVLISSFGLPHQVAAMVLLTQKTRAHILQWLTAAEALARRVLLIQAASLPKPNIEPPTKPKHVNTDAAHGRPGFAYPEDSEKWTVTFKIIERTRKKRKERSEFHTLSERPRPNPADARAIAERIEALIRVCAKPERYAQRLARRLYANPYKAKRIAAPIKKTRGVNPAHTLLQEVQPLALAATVVFKDLS